ncbi:MAG: hypothetical protein ACI30V_05405 [Muribaculaceae bacterium]
MRKVLLVIVAAFCMEMFNSCDEPEFTTSDSETVINSDTNHTDTDNINEETEDSMQDE